MNKGGEEMVQVSSRQGHHADQDLLQERVTKLGLQIRRLAERVYEWETKTRSARIGRSRIPIGAQVLVVSKGDENLLNLDGRRGEHFPQTADGTYAGYHPADSAAAIAHLNALRSKGAEYLLLPNTAFWWLDFYGDFRRHLDTDHQRIWAGDDCVIWRLTPPGKQAGEE